MLPDVFRRLKPLYGKLIDVLWIEYQTCDVERKREIDELLMLLAVKHLGISIGDEKLVLDAPPAALIGEGEFTIGMVSYPSISPYPFRVKRNELLRHLFILGPTGTGKSTLLLNVLLQIQAAGAPFMVFDFKRNYRCLLRATGSAGLVVFTVGRNSAPLALNALAPPPGVEFEEWAAALSDIISTSYLLMQGARNVLKEALLLAHEEHGAAATLAHAHALLATELDATKSGSRRYGWLESSTRSLEELSKGSFGRALNATNHTPVHELLTRSVIFEMHGFGDDQKRFFCLFFLQAVLLLRKNSSAPREELQHLLVFDEAHNIFPRERPGEVSIPARLAREVREFGEGIIAATQQADVSESLIANSGFKFILRCDYPKDVTFASQLLQIEPRWLPKLPIGSGIARLPVRFYSPILFTFSVQPIKNLTITDKEVHAQWARQALPHAAPASSPAKERVVSEREAQLLHDIAAQPISTITDRYQRLGWNAKIGNAIKDAVMDKGLAVFEEVRTPTSRVKILSFTTTGEQWLQSTGITLPRSRHGGAEHEYWKHMIAARLQRSGYQLTPEYPVGGGKTVDLLAERDTKKVFVEIETGKSDIAANAAKLRDVLGRIVFVFTNEQERETHRSMILAVRPDAELLTTATLESLG